MKSKVLKLIVPLLLSTVLLLTLLSWLGNGTRGFSRTAQAAPHPVGSLKRDERSPSKGPPEADQVAGALSDAQWVIQCVDCPKRFSDLTDRSLRVDGNGLPHIVYGGDHLYYAWFDGFDWHLEVADPAEGVGRRAALVLDQAGLPHISYINEKDQTIKHVFKDTAGWHAEVVMNAGDRVHDTAIELDNLGYPAISFAQCTEIGYQGLCFGNQLVYAHQDVTGWHTETLPVYAPLAQISLGLDSENNPHIAYIENRDLYLASKEGTSWQIESVAANGSSPSLSLDEDDYPHLSYGADGLNYAYRDADGWHFQNIEFSDSAVLATSIVLDSAARPHIGYNEDANQALKYASRNEGVWHIQTVDHEAKVSEAMINASIALALDSEDHVFLIFANELNLSLYSMSQQAGSWQSEVVDEQSKSGQGSSLDLGPNDVPHLSYFHGLTETNMLQYSYQDLAGWHSEAVDTLNGTGFESEIVIAMDGRPHILYASYCDDTACNDLRYAYRDAGGWHLEEVDQVQGWTFSFALDHNNHPHMSYFDVSDESLGYARKIGTGWSIETVADNTAVGWNQDLVLDNTGQPHICYFDATNGRLVYTRRMASDWHPEVVDSERGSGCSIALDEDGLAHISYAGGGLWYAQQTGSGWQIENVTGGNPINTSLALDKQGAPHILLRASTANFYDPYVWLNYAYRDITGWHTETLASKRSWWYARSLSLDFDAAGRPHAGYPYDNGVRYARQLPRVGPLWVRISGLSGGLTNSPLAFTAEVGPISTTTPLTYLWQTSGRYPETHYTDLADQMNYRWQLSGTQRLTVTAANHYGVVSATHLITITEPSEFFYFPIVPK